jgi:hypothetical protein
MTLVIELTPEQQMSLERRAAQRGLSVTDYARVVLEKDLQPRPSLDEILAPFRREVEASGITDRELTALFEEARNEVFQQDQTGTP